MCEADRELTTSHPLIWVSAFDLLTGHVGWVAQLRFLSSTCFMRPSIFQWEDAEATDGEGTSHDVNQGEGGEQGDVGATTSSLWTNVQDLMPPTGACERTKSCLHFPGDVYRASKPDRVEAVHASQEHLHAHVHIRVHISVRAKQQFRERLKQRGASERSQNCLGAGSLFCVPPNIPNGSVLFRRFSECLCVALSRRFLPVGGYSFTRLATLVQLAPCWFLARVAASVCREGGARVTNNMFRP